MDGMAFGCTGCGGGVPIGAGSNSRILGGAYPLQSILDLMHLGRRSACARSLMSGVMID